MGRQDTVGDGRSVTDAQPQRASAPQGAHGPDILFVADRLPGADSGYSIRVRNVVEALSSLGRLHVVVLDSSRHGECFPADIDCTVSIIRAVHVNSRTKAARALRTLPTPLGYANDAELRANVTAAVGHRTWDLIWCSRVAAHLYTMQIGSHARIVDFDDLADRLLVSKMRDRAARHGRLRSAPRNAWDRLDALRWSRLQRSIADGVDRVAVCSEHDRSQLGVPNAVVLPNGYPMPPRAEPQPEAPPDRTLLFVGPLTYEPNRLAVEWLANEVLPRVRQRLDDAELLVVGDCEGVSMRRLSREGVTFTGWVPDVGPYYARAGVAVTPVRSGGGTRLKVMEALARRVPLVSTSFGVEGIDLWPGRELLVADEDSAFADACVAALTDVPLREQLVTAGHERYIRDLSSHVAVRAVTTLAGSVLTSIGRGNDGRAADAEQHR